MSKLHFYFSTMDAGKSTDLLRADYNYRERGMDTRLFTPMIDDRYEVGTIVSRIGLHAKAYPFDSQFDFFAYMSEEIKKHPNIYCVLLDEAQFLKKTQVAQLKKITEELHRPVLAYGLRTDFQGELFEGSRYLLAWAEELVEIKTICHCGRKATMVLRVDAEGSPVRTGNQIEIGGNDRYVSVCYKHFILGESKARS